MVIVEQTTKYSDKIAMRIVVFSRLDKLAICSFESVFDEAAMHALLGPTATAARGRARIGDHMLSLRSPVSLPCFVLPVARQGALFRNTNVQIQ